MEEYCISWDAIHLDAVTLSKSIQAYAKSIKGIIAISRGGLFPALIVAEELGVHFIETVCMNSYTDSHKQKKLEVLKYATAHSLINDGEGYIILDDLVDTGQTLNYLRQFYCRACYAVLYAKPLGEPTTDIFVSTFPQNTWLKFPWE